MLAALYRTKAALKRAIGTQLVYQETSMFGSEYKSDGLLTVVGPGAYERKWYANVTMKDGVIAKVQ